MSGPWMKFYPSDWRADPALRMCSIAARGLWMEMLCVMHEAEPRGTLRVNGRPLTDRQLGTLAGCDVGDLLAELEEAGVFSRDDQGTIYSRRMMRDEAKAKEDKANGKRGGNPALKRGDNPPDKAQKPEARTISEKEEPNGSSKKPAPRSELENVLDANRAQAVIDHRQRLRKPLTAYAAQKLAAKFAQCPDPNAAADAMIANGWQGFEPEWLENRQPRGSPPQRQIKGPDAFDALGDFINGQVGDRAGSESDWSDAPGFPHLIEHQR